MAGLTSTGFTPKTTAEIIDELGDDVQSQLGNVNTQADSVLGIILAVVAARLGALWDLALALYRAFDPDTSTGDALVGLAALTGTTPLDAAPSTVTAAVDLDAGTTLPAGSRVHVADAPARIFETDAEIVNGTFRAWCQASLTAVDDGPTVADEGTLTEIDTPVAGWNAVINEDVPGTRWAANAEPYPLSDGMTLGLITSDGPFTITFQSADFSDIGNATAQEVIDVINTTLTGAAGSLDGAGFKIVASTAGAGTAGVEVDDGTALTALGLVLGHAKGKDGAAAIPGHLVEMDAELRARRGDDLERQGTGTSETLRAQLLELDGVLDASVYQNRTDFTDGNGLPPHSFRAVVWGPTADAGEIAQTVFDNSPLGIESKGSQSQAILDSQGTSITVRWDDATEVPIYVAATLSALEKSYAGDDVVKAALVDYIDSLLMGDDVISKSAEAKLFQAGVYDVPSWAIDTVSPPVASANIAIDLDEATTLDVADIDLTVNFVTPS